MCYYSTTLRREQVRDAKPGEDLTLRADGHGHQYPVASDGKIVCMTQGREVHIASLQLSGMVPRGLRLDLNHLIGKPVSGYFSERVNSGYAADRIMIDDDEVHCYHEVHLLYLAPGTTFYVGPKRVDVAEKLGVNDPSITLDHMSDPKEGEETPAAPTTPAEPAQGEPVKEPASDAPVAA
jgi:hypothetical protein